MRFLELFHATALIKPDNNEEETRNGIVIPATAQGDSGMRPTGVVQMVGPGTDEVSMSVEVGQRVLYNQSVPVPVGDDELHLVDMRAILGVIEPR